MKKEITRLSPHQNGKLFGLVLALGSLLFVLPISLAMVLTEYWDVILQLLQGHPASLSDAHLDANESAALSAFFLVLLVPPSYFALGYVAVAVGCVLYNFLVKHVGGFEFESRNEDE